jgi:histidine decarboxylase
VRLRKVFQETGLDKINHKVHSKGKTIEESRTGYWIHVDGAYGGSYLPYLDRHFERKKTDIHSVVDRVRDEKGNITEYTIESIPDIDFIKYPELCSVVTSGHKCPGAPWPSGVFMTKHKYQLYPPSSPMYIGSMDSTLSGSRNALSPIILWEYLSTKTDIDLENDSFRCFELARELEEKLRHIANEKNKKNPALNLEVYRAPFSLSLILSRLKRSLIQRYTLADQDLYSADGLSKRSFNHMYIMEHMIANRKLVDDFLHDVAQEHSFEDELIPLAPELFPHLSEDIEYRAKRKKLFKFGHGK